MEILPVGITRGDGPMHGLRLLDPWRRGVGEGGRKTPVLDLVHGLAALHAAGTVDEDAAADEGDDDHQGYDADNDLDCCADEAHLVVVLLDSLGGCVVKGRRRFDSKELVTSLDIVVSERGVRYLCCRQVNLNSSLLPNRETNAHGSPALYLPT